MSNKSIHSTLSLLSTVRPSSLRLEIHSNHIFDLSHIMFHHLTYPIFEGSARRRTSGTGAQHCDGKYSGVFVKGNVLYIATVVLHCWSNPGPQDLLNEFYYL